MTRLLTLLSTTSLALAMLSAGALAQTTSPAPAASGPGMGQHGMHGMKGCMQGMQGMQGKDCMHQGGKGMHHEGKGMHHGPRATARNTPGWSLMTPEERTAHRDKMMGMKSADECKAYMTEHHEHMVARAKDKGVAMPAIPRRDPCGGMPKS